MVSIREFKKAKTIVTFNISCYIIFKKELLDFINKLIKNVFKTHDFFLS